MLIADLWRRGRIFRGITMATGALVAILLCAAPGGPPKTPPTKFPTFESDIVPILTNRTCLGCHGPSLKMKELNLSTYQSALRGSEAGPVIVPGKPEESRLFRMVKDGVMPPGGKIHLSDEELGVIRVWIEAGAKSTADNHSDPELSKVSQHDVIPIMMLRCTACHGLRRQEAGLHRQRRSRHPGGGVQRRHLLRLLRRLRR